MLQEDRDPPPLAVVSGVLLAVAVVGRAVADLAESRHAWDARHFLTTRLREPDNLWGQLLGDLCPSPAQMLAAIQRKEAARPGAVGLDVAG
jgi:hypothetical protein